MSGISVRGFVCCFGFWSITQSFIGWLVGQADSEGFMASSSC